MKQKILILTLILLMITAWSAFSGQDQAGEATPEPALELERLDTSAFETPRRPGAVFAHDEHNEAAELDDCAICHHVWEDNKLVEDESSEDSPCSECHGLLPGPDNRFSLSVAFHKQCRDCHFDSGKGPLLCGECHIKE
ncbi:MAG: cytochrome c3 family protein [Desulfobacteraceae bacterium]|nr:cytochrome c3 family protein [Desulfobacteraceae bacterium]